MMAAYNAEMNRRLYAAAAMLKDAERKSDRGAFFGSLHGTLNHLLWADGMWMSRFDGWDAPAGGIAGSTAQHDDFVSLGVARVAADAGIEAWAARLDTAWLVGVLRWYSGAAKRDMARPRWIAVAHLFNHQTHHRGQVHCLLTQLGVRPRDTDLPFIVDLDAYGLH